MSKQNPDARRAVRGTIGHRLLANAVVDPEEAARLLPAGLRPHVTSAGFADSRPAPSYLMGDVHVTWTAKPTGWRAFGSRVPS